MLAIYFKGFKSRLLFFLLEELILFNTKEFKKHGLFTLHSSFLDIVFDLTQQLFRLPMSPFSFNCTRSEVFHFKNK